MIRLGLVLGASWGVFWGLLGAQVGPSWLPKASWTRSGLQKAILQKYHVFQGKTTHSGLPEPPKTGQDRPKTGPRSSREALENIFLPCYFLESIFFWGGALKIGAKFDQKIVDNKNRPKMTPRESKSPPGTPQGRPRTPQGRPRTPPGAPREPPSWPNTENPPTKTMVFYKLLVSLDDFPESWKLRSCQVEMRRSRGIRGFCYIVLL